MYQLVCKCQTTWFNRGYRTDSILHGSINLRNECTDSGCSNRAIVDGSVSKSAESRVQQHLQDDNKCKDGSACGNDGSSNAIVVRATIVQ